MKIQPEIQFQTRLPLVCIIVKDGLYLSVKKLIKDSKAVIKESHSPKSRGDSNWGLTVENITEHLLMAFMEQSDIHVDSYTKAVNDNILVDFKNDDVKRVKSIIIKFKNGKYENGTDRWNDRIFIYSGKRSSDDKEIKEYAINWVSSGTVSIESAQQFFMGFHIAIELAKECTEKFVKNNQ